jgi:beta-lactamase regulating signal transducer with metallopeptidase domain
MEANGLVLMKGVLVLALASLVLLLAWRASACTRRAILVWGFLGALVVPPASLVASRIGFESLNVVSAPLARVVGDPAIDALQTAPLPAYRYERVRARVTRMARDGELADWFFMLWLAGCSVALARLTLAHLRVHSFRRRSEPLPERLVVAVERARSVILIPGEVRLSSEIGTPVATGIFSAGVLLPKTALQWDSARTTAVLLHEFVHLEQRDALFQLVSELVCAMQWYNPVAWWAKRRLERERELAADERVIATGLRPSDYAGQLVAVAAELAAHRIPAVGVAVVGRSMLAHRVERILSAPTIELPRRWQGRVLSLVAVAVSAVVACARASATPPTETRSTPAPEAGDSSIDAKIQEVADAETQQLKLKWKAKGATVVVLEPSSGRVLAVSNPELAGSTRTAASTFKPLVVAAALDEGIIRPDERFDCEHGRRTYSDGLLLRDSGDYGELSVTEILARSSNIGVSKIFDRLGGPRLQGWFRTFHLDRPAPLPGSVAGSLHALSESSAGTMQGAVTAIGFGAKVSPLHLAAAYATFANGGMYVAPTLSRSTVARTERVLEPTTAKEVRRMLEFAVDSGTGQAARIEGVRVAGKTGTADADDAGQSQSLAYFVGIVPADAPRFVIAVVVVEPEGGIGGARVSAPAFASVAAKIL